MRQEDATAIIQWKISLWIRCHLSWKSSGWVLKAGSGFERRATVSKMLLSRRTCYWKTFPKGNDHEPWQIAVLSNMKILLKALNLQQLPFWSVNSISFWRFRWSSTCLFVYMIRVYTAIQLWLARYSLCSMSWLKLSVLASHLPKFWNLDL